MADRKPVAKVEMWPVSAAIWANDSREGKRFYSVTFQRAYYDDAKKIQNSDSFNADELLLLAKVADQAHTQIHKLKQKDREASRQAQQEAGAAFDDDFHT